MFRYLIGGGDFRSYIIGMLLSLPVILLSLSAHEAAHGLTAYWLGDPTARNLGRLTLNPVKHLDPIGFISMLVFGFGWARPVPINARNFRNPRAGMALSALAGPVSNVLLSLVFLLILRFLGYGVLMQHVYTSDYAFNAAYFFVLFLYYGVYMNVTLAVFNFLPVPPLDGSRVLYVLLPPRAYFGLMKYERYISLVILLLLFLGPLSWLIRVVVSAILHGMWAMTGMTGFLVG